jgi:hypothetical protein
VAPADLDRVRWDAGGERRDGSCPAPAGGGVRSAKQVAALTPRPVNGMIIPASTTLLVESGGRVWLDTGYGRGDVHGPARPRDRLRRTERRGKSTTLRVALGPDAPDPGSAAVGHRDATSTRRRVRPAGTSGPLAPACCRLRKPAALACRRWTRHVFPRLRMKSPLPRRSLRWNAPRP